MRDFELNTIYSSLPFIDLKVDEGDYKYKIQKMHVLFKGDGKMQFCCLPRDVAPNNFFNEQIGIIDSTYVLNKDRMYFNLPEGSRNPGQYEISICSNGDLLAVIELKANQFGFELFQKKN